MWHLDRAHRERITYPAETALLIYLFLAAVSTWILRPPHTKWILVGHGLTMGVFGILRQASTPSSRAKTVRALFPLAMFPVLSKVAGLINVGLERWVLDKPWERLEALLFRSQPSMMFSKWMPSPVFSELFHSAYLGSYFLVILLPLVLAAQRRHLLLTTTVYGLCLCFFVSLLFHIWLPVKSPSHRFPPLAKSLREGIVYRLAHATVENIGVIGGAFPSSLASLLTFNGWVAFRFERRVFWWTILPTFLSFVGSVYSRFYFGVDILGGVGVGAMCYRLLRRRLEHTAQEKSVPQSRPISHRLSA